LPKAQLNATHDYKELLGMMAKSAIFVLK